MTSQVESDLHEREKYFAPTQDNDMASNDILENITFVIFVKYNKIK